MKKVEIGKMLVTQEKPEEIRIITETKKTKPIPVPSPLSKEWCSKVSSKLKEVGFPIDDTTIFTNGLFDFLMGKEKPQTIVDFVGPVTEPEIPKTIQPPPTPTPTVKTIVNELLQRLNEREQKMFNTVCQKYSKKPEELAKHFLELAEQKRVSPNLLIFRDWRKVGGERLRRVVLMNEKLEIFKFFTSSANYFPPNTCVKLITNIPVPFAEGRIIGISNRTLSMNFNDYAEIVDGNIEMRKIQAEPRIDGLEKINETNEIYTKIPRAQDVLNPIDDYSSLSKVVEITKQHGVPVEEVVMGILEAVYPTSDGLRLAIHIGDSLVPSQRVTVWIESNRVSLTENDLHKLVRAYGYIEHGSQEWKGQMQDNLQINAYNFILED